MKRRCGSPKIARSSRALPRCRAFGQQGADRVGLAFENMGDAVGIAGRHLRGELRHGLILPCAAAGYPAASSDRSSALRKARCPSADHSTGSNIEWMAMPWMNTTRRRATASRSAPRFRPA